MNDRVVLLGCETLVADPPSWLRTGRLGLLSNQASVTRSLEHVSRVLSRAGGRIVSLLSPQHGFYAEKQANMEESEDAWDASLNVPVFSLYGKVREPTPEILEKIDILVIDLQDVGTRVYTYGTTMGLCIEAASRAGTKVVVLDRPNPINGVDIEGNLLKPEWRSFVGRYPIPMRHGLTLGELAKYIAAHCKVDCEVEVVLMKGWERSYFFPDTGIPWVFPSPNMPSWESAMLYPGMVLLEGTNVSEGRGTTLPFQLFGAPFIDQQKLLNFLKGFDLEGVFFRPVCFEPVHDKWRGELCRGFQIHITDREKLRPYRLGLLIVQGLCRTHHDKFRWLPPPYEYEHDKRPIDIILGDGELRHRLEDGASVSELEADWSADLHWYKTKCEPCRLYP